MAWLSAAQALELLKVRPQTLYAHVSRKSIRVRPDPKDARRSLYHEQDVLRQARMRAGRRRDEVVAEGTIGWGDPVLPTGLSTVVNGRLFYRGQDVLQLARNTTLEAVALLLWDDAGTPPPRLTQEHGSQAPRDGTPGLARALTMLAARTATEAPTQGQSPEALRASAWAVFHALTDALIGPPPEHQPMQPLHQGMAIAWHSPRAADLIRQALVLLADHELTASSFAARVTASTGASLSACVLSGLATLGGPLHGGAHARVQEMVKTSLWQGPEDVLRERLAGASRNDGTPSGGLAQPGSGALYPAFGHPLYAQGDPRARLLLQRITPPAGFAGLQAAALELAGEHPSVDFALTAMARAHGWPDDAPLLLFAASRCVGWLAHALEQVRTGTLIRPRARYTGPALPATIEQQRAPAATAGHSSQWFPT